MDLKKKRIDLVKAEDGVWIPIDADTKLKVARMGSAGYRAAYQKHKDALNKTARELTTDDLRQVLTAAIAEGLLLDWSGLDDGDEKDIPYSYEKAYELLSDKSNEEFRDLVTSLAQESESFRENQIEEDLGNSEAT